MRVVIQMDPSGAFDVITDEPCDVYAVCDWTPNDRVYRLTTAHQVGAPAVDAVLGDSVVGHSGDERHAAVAHRIRSRMNGTLHLMPVDK